MQTRGDRFVENRVGCSSNTPGSKPGRYTPLMKSGHGDHGRPAPCCAGSPSTDSTACHVGAGHMGRRSAQRNDTAFLGECMAAPPCTSSGQHCMVGAAHAALHAQLHGYPHAVAGPAHAVRHAAAADESPSRLLHAHQSAMLLSQHSGLTGSMSPQHWSDQHQRQAHHQRVAPTMALAGDTAWVSHVTPTWGCSATAGCTNHDDLEGADVSNRSTAATAGTSSTGCSTSDTSRCTADGSTARPGDGSGCCGPKHAAASQLRSTGVGSSNSSSSVSGSCDIYSRPQVSRSRVLRAVAVAVACTAVALMLMSAVLAAVPLQPTITATAKWSATGSSRAAHYSQGAAAAAGTTDAGSSSGSSESGRVVMGPHLQQQQQHHYHISSSPPPLSHHGSSNIHSSSSSSSSSTARRRLEQAAAPGPATAATAATQQGGDSGDSGSDASGSLPLPPLSQCPATLDYGVNVGSEGVPIFYGRLNLVAQEVGGGVLLMQAGRGHQGTAEWFM